MIVMWNCLRQVSLPERYAWFLGNVWREDGMLHHDGQMRGASSDGIW